MIPTPKTVEVCEICEQPWVKHVELARSKYHHEDDDQERFWRDLRPEEQESYFTVEICIQLLKEANRGPAGPTGATGPMGMQGEPGKDA